jgi:hypothetical protein
MSRKKLFSLIEIAVAMAVAAIGVAAIMALLPIAVKSTSDSVGDTLAADAANTVIAQLDRAAWEHFDWIQGLKTTKPSTFADAARATYAGETLDENSYRIEPATGLQDGHFVFLFGPPGEKADFAAEVFCWKESKTDNLKLTSADVSSGKPKTVNLNTIVHPETRKPVLVRVFIEITWPITKPYKKNTAFPRQSRTFVREYFDPTYTRETN